jgi:hypothetical protein
VKRSAAQGELDPGDDAEVALAAADGPEQVGVALGVHDPDLAVGGHEGQAAYVVGGEAAASRHRAQPAVPGGLHRDPAPGPRGVTDRGGDVGRAR